VTDPGGGWGPPPLPNICSDPLM